MTVLTRSLRAALPMLLALGLLAAGMPCAWVCSGTAAAHARGAEAHAQETKAPARETKAPAHVASHCAERARTSPATPDAPATPTTPCGEDCSGCAARQVSIPGTALALDASSAPCAPAIPASQPSRAAFAPPPTALCTPGQVGDLPPPDILALTTTLLI